MKPTKLIQFLPLLLIALWVVSTSCSRKKSATSGAREISVPFEGKQYRTDKNNFRARGTGNSPDLATAQKIARQNAKTELASNIETVIKAVTDQYTNQRTFTNAQEFNNRFEELSRAVVNQTLNDTRVIDEKTFQEKDGRFQVWVAMEMPKDALENSIARRVNRDDALRQDYDQQKFREIFDAEMEKIEQSRP